MNEEFETLEEVETYEYCKEVPDKVLPSGMILRVKHDETGKPARFKGRLVSRGNRMMTCLMRTSTLLSQASN